MTSATPAAPSASSSHCPAYAKCRAGARPVDAPFPHDSRRAPPRRAALGNRKYGPPKSRPTAAADGYEATSKPGARLLRGPRVSAIPARRSHSIRPRSARGEAATETSGSTRRSGSALQPAAVHDQPGPSPATRNASSICSRLDRRARGCRAGTAAGLVAPVHLERRYRSVSAPSSGGARERGSGARGESTLDARALVSARRHCQVPSVCELAASASSPRALGARPSSSRPER